MASQMKELEGQLGEKIGVYRQKVEAYDRLVSKLTGELERTIGERNNSGGGKGGNIGGNGKGHGARHVAGRLSGRLSNNNNTQVNYNPNYNANTNPNNQTHPTSPSSTP